MLAAQAAKPESVSLSIAIARDPSCVRIQISNEGREQIRCDYLQVGRTLAYSFIETTSGAPPELVSTTVREVGREPVKKDGTDPYPPYVLDSSASRFYDWSPEGTFRMRDGSYRVQFAFRPRETKFAYRGKVMHRVESPLYEVKWLGGKFTSVKLIQ